MNNNWKGEFVAKVLNQRAFVPFYDDTKEKRDMTDFILDYIFPPFIFILIAICVLGVAALVYQSYEEVKHCAKWEDKIVHQNAYTSYTFVGIKPMIMVPIYHPAGDYQQNVCTQPK